MRTFSFARRTFAALLIFAFAATLQAQDAKVDAFFDEFAAQWVEADPDLATGTRYFTGEKQTQLERQLTPQTRAWQTERVALARRGLRDLGALGTTRMTQTQRISAELMRWQLESVVSNEPFFDYNATAYMVGQLKLIELRDRARRELGDKFSFKAFHSAVLGAGTVPLDLLEKIVEQHIQSVKKS